MKWKYLLLIFVLLGVTAYFVQNEVMTLPQEKTVDMGFPLPWIQQVTTTTTDGLNVTVSYEILWTNLFIDVAVYGVALFLIFG